jgi:hypothetical protein
MAIDLNTIQPAGTVPDVDPKTLTDVIVTTGKNGMLVTNPLTGQQYDGVFNGLKVIDSQFYSPTDGSPARLSVDKAGKMYVNGKPYSGYKGTKSQGEKSMDPIQQNVDRSESKSVQKNHRGEMVNMSPAIAKMKTITAPKGGAGIGTNFMKSKK